MESKEKVIRFTDEQNDDFAGTNIKRRALGKGFRYIHKNVFFRVFEFVLYFIVAAPLVYLLQKLYSHQKFVNRGAFKKAKDTGYFIYSNHTQLLNDAYIGPMATYPKKCFVITGPDATSIRGIRTVVQALGAIPPASNYREAKEMLSCLAERIGQKSAVMIYPDPALGETEAAKQLHQIAYETMCRRAEEHSTYEYIRYVKDDVVKSQEI